MGFVKRLLGKPEEDDVLVAFELHSVDRIREVHRQERDIYDNIRLLLAAAGRAIPPLDNVPNRYLKPKGA